MKLIIAGGRDHYVSPEFIQKVLEEFDWLPSEIVSGASGRPDNETKIQKREREYLYANGIDGCGEKYSIKYLKLEPTRFPAQWLKYAGLSAGPRRNREMAHYADKLLLIWDGHSKGSSNMKKEMSALGKPIIEVIIRE